MSISAEHLKDYTLEEINMLQMLLEIGLVGVRIAQRQFCTGVTLAWSVTSARSETLAWNDTVARSDILARTVTFARYHFSMR